MPLPAVRASGKRESAMIPLSCWVFSSCSPRSFAIGGCRPTAEHEQPRGVGSISEGLCGCFVLIQGRSLTKTRWLGDLGGFGSLFEMLTCASWI